MADAGASEGIVHHLFLLIDIFLFFLMGSCGVCFFGLAFVAKFWLNKIYHYKSSSEPL